MIHQKRDGSTVMQRLKESRREQQNERHRQFMDRKMGRDRVETAPAPDPTAGMWAQVAQQLGMTAQPDGQGGTVMVDPKDGSTLHLQRDSDGALHWDLPSPPAPEPGAAEPEMQLVRDESGTLRWVFPGEEAPPNTQPVHNDLWKQVGEQLGMEVKDNGQGGFLFRDKG